MMKDQEALNDERNEDDDSDENDDDGNYNEVLSLSGNPESNENINGLEGTFWAQKHGIKHKGTRNKNKVIKKKLARVIELGVFTDESFYRRWATMHPVETTKKINQYVLSVVNNVNILSSRNSANMWCARQGEVKTDSNFQMNYLYQQPSMDPKISFRLVNVGVQKTIPRGLQPSTTAERYLDSFCKFAGQKDKNGAIWDHAMMITGLDLKDSSGNDNLGNS